MISHILFEGGAKVKISSEIKPHFDMCSFSARILKTRFLVS